MKALYTHTPTISGIQYKRPYNGLQWQGSWIFGTFLIAEEEKSITMISHYPRISSWDNEVRFRSCSCRVCIFAWTSHHGLPSLTHSSNVDEVCFLKKEPSPTLISPWYSSVNSKACFLASVLRVVGGKNQGFRLILVSWKCWGSRPHSGQLKHQVKKSLDVSSASCVKPTASRKDPPSSSWGLALHQSLGFPAHLCHGGMGRVGRHNLPLHSGRCKQKEPRTAAWNPSETSETVGHVPLPILPFTFPMETRSDLVSETGTPACVLSCFSHVWPLWTVVRQAPLSVGFSRQEHWSG